MSDSRDQPPPDFSAAASRPRATRTVRLLAYLLLLALAIASIWFIDRGAMMSNSHPPPATQGLK